MAALNYAVDYSKVLANAFPYSLYFGCCYNTSNNNLYKWTGANTIKIPTLTTTGRVDSNRDTIATAQRNYNNGWETKVLNHQRKWSTLVHPQDIDQTNMVASIANITQTYNEQSKFPEMDAYCVSKIYADWTALGKTATTTALDETNVLKIFDQLMQNMDEKRVPGSGRVLHVTPAVKTMLKNASQVTRQIKADGASDGIISREVNRLDEVQIVSVPPDLMKTIFDFTQGYAAGVGAKDIKMFLMHPLAVITPISYQFSQLDEPSAVTEGKYIYFEESYEDVFILNNKADALQFVTSA
jgi:hypothetical protein